MNLMIIALFASLFFNSGKSITERRSISMKWVIEKRSSLSIQGKSNINSFRCDVTEYLHPDTIEFSKEDHYQLFFTLKGGPIININRFDCHQRYITSDLKKILKADAGSCLKIGLLSIGNFVSGNTVQNVKGLAAIELVGITQNMEVDFSVQTDERGYLHLSGKRKVLFSDFGLIPPRKLAGLVKVEEELNVTFQLILRSVDGNINNKIYL